MRYHTGIEYKGAWKKGMFHGHGIIIYKLGTIRSYNGEWQANKKHGNGILQLFNDDIYDGHFKNNHVCSFFFFAYVIYCYFFFRFMEVVLILGIMVLLSKVNGIRLLLLMQIAFYPFLIIIILLLKNKFMELFQMVKLLLLYIPLFLYLKSQFWTY